MSKRTLKIAAAQLGPIQLAESRSEVVKRLINMLRKAHGVGAELVVFPELALTTFFPRYWMDDQRECDEFFEREMPGPETQPLFDEAKRLGIGFHIGYAELTEHEGQTHRFNTAILVDSNGEIIGKYRKIHLPGHSEKKENAPFQHLEKKYFEVGNLGFPVFPAFRTIIGMAVCNDRRWPETYRVMALQGAEMVVLGYNTPTENLFYNEPLHLRMFHHKLVLQAAAYQNGMWVIAVGKAGEEDGHRLHGGSCIVAPTGEIVAQALTEGDEVVTFEADLDLGNYIKQSVFNFAKHRRIEHYDLITSQTGIKISDEIKSKL